MSKWQPIETAPKGKKIIGGYFNGAGNWCCFFCQHYGRHELEVEYSFQEDPADDDGDLCYAPAGWYETCEGDEEGTWSVKPTHWQPLPSPPQQEGE